MNFAFVISFISGIATMFGSLILFFKNNNKYSVISKSLSFAAGVMISVSILDLIPSSILGLNQVFYIFPTILITITFVVVGFILSQSIEKVIPNYNNSFNKKLYKTGMLSMITLILHNIPEGIATYLTATTNLSLGLKLAVAIALHNIPEGISISIPIYFSTGNRKKAIIYTFISGMSEFVGAIVASQLFVNFNILSFLNILYSIIAGIMLSLSFDELIPNALEYGSRSKVILFVFIGSLSIVFMHFLT